jgi:hypothetical protein
MPEPERPPLYLCEKAKIKESGFKNMAAFYYAQG